MQSLMFCFLCFRNPDVKHGKVAVRIPDVLERTD